MINHIAHGQTNIALETFKSVQIELEFPNEVAFGIDATRRLEDWTRALWNATISGLLDKLFCAA